MEILNKIDGLLNEEEVIEEADKNILPSMNALIDDLNNISEMFKVKILRKNVSKDSPSIMLMFEFVPTVNGILKTYEFTPKVKSDVFTLAKKHLSGFVKKPSELKPDVKDGKHFHLGAGKKDEE